MTREHVLLIMGALCVVVFYLLLKVSAIGEEQGDAEGSDLTALQARLDRVTELVEGWEKEATFHPLGSEERRSYEVSAKELRQALKGEEA